VVEQERAGLAALSSLGDPVRSQLYEFVAGSAGPVRRDEAAAATGIGRALAAYHLDKLVGLGLLTASHQRSPTHARRGAGRPAKVYVRSGHEFAVTVPPREYELAASLLAQAIESDSGGTSRAALHAVARRRGTELGKQHRACGPQPASMRPAGVRPAGMRPASVRRPASVDRIRPDSVRPDSMRPASVRPDSAGSDGARQAAEAALRAHGFEPARDQAGHIVLRNCPFRQLAIRNPDLICGMNLAFIEGLTEGVGGTGLRPALDPEPGRCCVVISQDQPA
jgi:predicted ArsR family transcriptional regulator